MAKTAPAHWNREDRDLLVELRTEMSGVRDDIKELKDNTASRLTLVEQQKIDRTEINRLQAEGLEVHQDHETRLRALERYRWFIAGGVLALTTVISLALQFFHV